MNPYEELGITPDATAEQINRAYRRAAKDAHPDAGGDAERFARLGKAVAILRDPERRAKFDRDGTIDDSNTPSTEARAAELLCQAFSAVLHSNAHRLDQVDAINLVKNDLRNRLQKLKVERSTLSEAKKANAKAMQRLIIKGESTVLRGVLNQMASEIEEISARICDLEHVCNEALTLADEFGWEPPMSEPSQTMMFSVPSFATTNFTSPA